MPEKKWTDERHDDLNTKVDVGFARVDEDIRGLRGEMTARFDKLDERFDKVGERFDSLRRDLLKGAIVIIATLIGCCATLIGVAVL